MINSSITPQPIKDLFNISFYDTDQDGKEKRVYKADPYALHVLRSLPFSRMQGTMQRLFNDDSETADKILAFLTGAKIYSIDQETQKYFRDRDAFGEFMEHAERHNIGWQPDLLYLDKAKARAYGEERE
jgi:hypothetical protein